MPAHEIEVNEGRIEYEEIPGDPALAPLVFLHEGLGSVSTWRSFPADLASATGRRGLVYSRHGHGRSGFIDRQRGIDYMHREAIDTLQVVLTSLGYGRPVLVGHSDGASIALIYAGSGVGPADALVLMAPHVIVEDRTIAGIETARETFLATDLADRLARHHDDPVSTFWGWNDVWLSAGFREWDIRDLLPGVTCPVLTVQCADDPYGTLTQLDLIENTVAAPVTRSVFDGCGHSPHLERPNETLEAIVAFLADLERPARVPPP
jgi:pimeloyl-ACP methyl ester carboxylesterase